MAITNPNQPWYNINAINPNRQQQALANTKNQPQSSFLYNPTPLPTPNYNMNPFGSNRQAPGSNYNINTNARWWDQVWSYTPWNTWISQASIDANPNIKQDWGKGWYSSWASINKTTTKTITQYADWGNKWYWGMVNPIGDNSGVVQAGWWFISPFEAWPDDRYKAPTVATTKNPVIKRVAQTQKQWYQPTNYSMVEQMDIKWLNDYIRSTQYDITQGKDVWKDEMLMMMRAQERAQELQTPAKIVNPLTELIDQKQQAKSEEQLRLESSNAEQMKAQQQAEASWVEAQDNLLLQQQQSEKNTLWYILGDVANSSYGVEQMNKIWQNFTLQRQVLRDASFARLEKYKAELAWATKAELDKYDTQIQELDVASANFEIQNAKEVNDYNIAQAKSTEDKLWALIELTNTQAMSKQPLTEQETAQAQALWDLLIDDKWNLNTDLYEKFSAVYPKLMNSALNQWALAKKAIAEEKAKWPPTTINTSNGAFFRDWEKYAPVEWSQPIKDFKPIAVNWTTYMPDGSGNYVQAWGTTWMDARPFASQYPNQARAKNNNPAGITRNDTFAQTLTNAWIQFQKGTQRPANEGWSYFSFPDLAEWFKAYNILWKSPSYQNLTVQQALNRWWTGNVPWIEQYLNQKVSSLDDATLSSIQQAQLKKESPSIFKFMESQGAQSDTNINMQNIELPAKATEFTKKSLSFAQKMEDAQKKLLDLWLEETFVDRSVVWQWFQDKAPEFAKSDKQKDLEVLKQAFVTWILRQESWAAITDSEFERYDKQFFPQVWDSLETIKKKQALRENAVRAMYQNAWNDAQWKPIVSIYDKKVTAVPTQTPSTEDIDSILDSLDLN